MSKYADVLCDKNGKWHMWYAYTGKATRVNQAEADSEFRARPPPKRDVLNARDACQRVDAVEWCLANRGCSWIYGLGELVQSFRKNVGGGITIWCSQGTLLLEGDTTFGTFEALQTYCDMCPALCGHIQAASVGRKYKRKNGAKEGEPFQEEVGNFVL
jgi:hypothetical protein